VRGLEIQKDSRRVFVNGTEVNLAVKEFELLLFLVQNPNRVFGREELFEKVWGLDSLGDAATVTVHIARIREKSKPTRPTRSTLRLCGEPDTGLEYKYCNFL
jgi:DNA-binding response OmpR family regulator